jgi:hypothetical protein
MTAFAAATAALMADPNMAITADWRAAPGDPPLTVRVIRSRPDEALATFRSASILPTDILLVALNAVPEPAAGHSFTIGHEVLTVLGQPQRDVVHAAWRVECRR